MTKRTRINATTFVIAVLITFSVGLATANATTPKPDPRPDPIPKQEQHQIANGGHGTAKAVASGTGTGTAEQSQSLEGTQTVDASSQAGSVDSTTSQATGDVVNISEHVFYSYAQSDRPASGCFKSGDAAGGKDGKFGALGFYWLDGNCWADHLASAERDVELNARLKCSGRKYRNAIAYDSPIKNRQRDCIVLVKASGLARIEAERLEMQSEINRLDGIRDQLLDERAIDKGLIDNMKQEVEAKRLREAAGSK